MGVVIFGTRAYGRVDSQGGEYAQTRFFHINYVPIVPDGSFWVTQALGDQAVGFPIKPNVKSIAATYLRGWGAIGAIAAFMTISGPAGATLGSACAALSVWSWTWHSLRGKRARLASDFRAAAFGVRCPPELMTDKFRDGLHQTLKVRWGRDHTGRSPDEVAQHGTASPAEAITAYGLLHLGAVERGRAGASERAAANRLIDGAHELRPTDADPYRGVEAAAAPPSLAAAVAARAQEVVAARPALRGKHRKPLFARPGFQLVGLLIAASLAVGAVAVMWDAVGPTHVVTERELTSTDLMREHRVAVQLDSVRDPDWRFLVFDHRERVVLGRIGKHLLPIVLADDAATPGGRVEGRLRFATNSVTLEPWREQLQRDPALDAITLDYVLDQTRDGDKWRLCGVCLLVVVGTTAGWVLWIRAWRRRRRAA